eukprot:Phypoly_transcript_15179.p1 GENE.Phypoly_transcript_15179~~Phypoly_transcript_15179.p1  ORF type:complete len:298 (+),score=34.66 Phypoly_transcript_15179:2-895(+)
MGETKDLPSFIKVYEQILSVLQTEDDFYKASLAYFRRAKSQGVVYVEMFFDPQMHTTRDVTLEQIVNGLRRAKEEARTFNMKCAYIMCFNRDRTIESAHEHLALALPYRDVIVGVGTDNLEHTGFPTDFAPIFEKAAEFGFRLTSHCDVDYKDSVVNIRGCLEELKVERIDHGVNVLEDKNLVNFAREKQIGFTVCPTLFYTPTPGQFNTRHADRCAPSIKEMIDAGLNVTLASDDPGVMAGHYIGDLYAYICTKLLLPKEQMVPFARNGFKMAWITDEEREEYLREIDDFVRRFAS